MRYGGSKFRTVRYIYRRYNCRYGFNDYYRLPKYRSTISGRLCYYPYEIMRTYFVNDRVFYFWNDG